MILKANDLSIVGDLFIITIHGIITSTFQNIHHIIVHKIHGKPASTRRAKCMVQT